MPLLSKKSNSNDDNIRQVQQLQEVNLCSWPYTIYYDDKVGPCKPGFSFYKFLLRKSNMSLHLPIPDTIIIDDISVVRMYTDPQTGILSLDKPDVDKQENKDKFILRCINNSVGTSIPLLRKAEPLEQRFVGVLKKSVANNNKNPVISNYCDLLTPLAFQSQILNAADHNAGICVVQKFVKCRGRKPSFFRIFWKATSIGSGNVSGYYVTNRKNGFKVTEDEEIIAKRMSENLDDSEINSDNDDDNGEAFSPKKKKVIKKTFLSDTEYFNQMQQKLDLTDSERNMAIKNSLNISKVVRDNCLCSLTNEKMEVNASCVARISVTRVVPTVLEPVRIHIENLVHWMQLSLSQRDELNVWISDMVCDFIRDEDENWWFIQLKGFKYDESCFEKVQKWYFCKQNGEPILKTTKKPEEVREKLENERGTKCQLCGLNFQDYMVISIERSGAVVEDDHQDLHDAAAFDKSHNKHAGEGKYRDVPAFGYQLTAKKSCSLACVYRDAKKPLTKYARDILAAYAVTLDARSAAPSFSEEAQINAKKNRHTSCICCYYCFQIVEEQEKFEDLCFAINALLGINAKPIDSNELQNENSDSPKKSPKKSKAIDDHFEYNAKIMSRRVKELLHWSNIKHKKKDTDYLKTDIKFFNDDLMLHKEKRAKVALNNINVSENISETEGGFALGTWKAQNFKRGTNHIRMIVMAHYMTDFDLPKNHNLQGTIGCIGYTLGTSIQAMCFTTKVDEEFKTDQVVWIKQARVQYFCANILDAKNYFADKYIEFHFYSLYPDNNHSTVSSHSSHGHHEPQPHPQLTTKFRISLNRLNWSGNASKDGTEKIEFDVPINIRGAFKEAKLRLSVAIKVDELLPDLDSVMRFVKEEEIFWPTDDYYPVLPLPETWIAMLSTSQTLRSELEESVVDDDEEEEAVVDIADNNEDDDNIFDDQENDAKAIKEMVKFIETEFHNVVNENNDDTNTTDGGITTSINVNKILNNIKMKTKRERIKEMASSKFMLNVITEDSNDEKYEDTPRNTDDDDNFENLKEYISLYPFVDRILQVLREESMKYVSSEKPNSSSYIEAIRILSMSIEQILLQEDLPSYVNWNFFKELMDECIPWAKVQRTRVKLALESKDSTTTDAINIKPNPKKTMTKGVGLLENHKKNRELLINELQGSHPNTILDVYFCNHDDFGARKSRRMTLALTIFDLASQYDDKVDIKTLHKFLEIQRKRLEKIITLFNDGAMTIPPVANTISDELSLVHILYSTILLCASSTLTSLLETYQNEGVTIISRIGFLSITEETFHAVSKNDYTPNETLRSFLNIATFQIITRQTERRATRVVSKLNNDVKRASFIASSPLSSFSTNSNITTNMKDITPFIFLCCDFHGAESFYLSDIYCTTCAKDDKVEFENNNRV